MNLNLREITLYRFRYIIGYVLFIILLFLLLGVDLVHTPPGLSSAEISSVTSSVNLNLAKPWAETIVNAPYHVLQKASVAFFGLSPLSIKLPSIILAIVLAVTMMAVIRRFFKLSTATVTALLMICSLPFLVMGRSGSPVIMLSVLSAILLAAGALVITDQKRGLIWRSLAGIAAVALLYTPLGVYPLLAFVAVAVIHPHLRYHITHTKTHEWIVVGVSAFIVSIPLLVAIFQQPKVLLTLSGIPSSLPSWSEMGANLAQLLGMLFSFYEPYYGLVAAPIFGLPLFLLMIMGTARLIRDHHSARAYFLLGLTSALLIVLALNPDYVLNIFVPAVLLLAVGIETLFREWYSLFPKNPYARIAALIPLSVLMVGIASTETSRYFDGYRHTTDISASMFDRTLAPLKNSLNSEPIQTLDKTYLVVPTDKLAYYDLLRREYNNLVVTNKPAEVTAGQANIVLADAKVNIENGVHGSLHRIVTSARTDDNLLFKIYLTPKS